jgi:hypothetical protein
MHECAELSFAGIEVCVFRVSSIRFVTVWYVHAEGLSLGFLYTPSELIQRWSATYHQYIILSA